MKKWLMLCVFVLFFLVTVFSASAGYDIIDDFDDASFDTTKWAECGTSVIAESGTVANSSSSGSGKVGYRGFHSISNTTYMLGERYRFKMATNGAANNYGSVMIQAANNAYCGNPAGNENIVKIQFNAGSDFYAYIHNVSEAAINTEMYSGVVDNLYYIGELYIQADGARVELTLWDENMSYLASYNTTAQTFANDTYYIGVSDWENNAGIISVDWIQQYNADPPQYNLNMSHKYPDNNTHFNDTASFNITATANTTYGMNCTLHINGTLNQTMSNIPAGAAELIFNLTYNGSNQLQETYNITCVNDDTIASLAPWIYYIDNVNPTIVSDAGFTANQKAVFNSLTGYINYTDEFLYSINITFNGSALFNQTDGFSGFYQYNFSENVENYTEGVYSIWTEACDGHTGLSIDDFSYTKTDKELKYGFDGDFINIYPKDKELFASVNTEKLEDRYTFEFSSKSGFSSSTTFVLESSNVIDLVDDSDYMAHFVIPSLKKWIDFENVNSKSYSIKKVSDYKYEITLIGLKGNSVTFNSIGELNCQDSTFYFYKMIEQETYDTAVIVQEPTTINLTVTNNATHVYDINASLYYNGSVFNLTGSSNATHYTFSQAVTTPLIVGIMENFTFIWEITGNDVVKNISNTTEILKPDIGNCSTYSQVWANFTVRDESNDSIITADMDSYLSFVYSTFYNGTYNDTVDDLSYREFCFFPEWANFTTDILIQYDPTDTTYGDREYNGDDLLIDNATIHNITLYALKGGTAVTIHVIDERDNDLENILVEVERWRIATNDYILVETEFTDPEGNAIVTLTEDEDYYRFKLYQGGVLEIQTDRFKIFDTEYEFILREDIVTRIGESISLRRFIFRNLTYSNSTDLVTFNWFNASSYFSYVCLDITTSNGSIEYGNCTSEVSGEWTHDLSLTNESYFAIATVISTGNFTYILETLGIDTRNDWRTFGTNVSVGLALVIFLLISMIGLSLLGYKVAINATIFLSFTSLILLYWFGLIPLTIGGLIGIMAVGIVLLIIVNRRKGI